MIFINCIAIDDEPPALRKMEEFISQVPYLKLLSTFKNSLDALSFLKEKEVDLIFLDIQMEVLNGIEFIKILKDRPKIILTTAYDSYAIQAFDFEINDYLLKPFSFERFLKSTEKVYKNILNEKQAIIKNQTQPDKGESFFFVKTEFRVERVDFEVITFIEGLKEYLGIHTTSGNKILTLQNFNNILEILPSPNFIRVHKSFIVAINKINSIRKNHIVIDKNTIPIGPKYKDCFFKHLKNRNLL